MSYKAIKTIRDYNLKLTISECKKIAGGFVNLINKKHPAGLDVGVDNVYFALPGFEHVTKNQPVVTFDPTEGMWILDTNTKFKNI